jgi:hypothetical protein
MRKLKPKYLFASAALLILLVVVVYVVTRSKDPIPNSPWPGNDVPPEEELMARLQRLREDTPVQRTLTYDDGSTPEITQALASLFDEDIRPVMAQLASPYEVSPQVAPVRPTHARIEDVVENYDVMALVGDRVEHINTAVNGRIDDVIDRVEHINAAVKDIRDAFITDVGFLLEKVEYLVANSASSDELDQKVRDLEALAQSASPYKAPEEDNFIPLLDLLQENSDNMQMQINAISQQVNFIIANSPEYIGDGNS